MADRADDPRALLSAATAVTTAVMAVMSDPEGRIHSETALAAIAATAGTLLLRHALPTQLDDLEPGSVVLVDEVNDTGMALLGYAMNAAAGLDITWDSSGDAVPDEHRPHAAIVDLVRKVEPKVVETLEAQGVDRSLWPNCCIISALDLVTRTREVLDPTIATAVITESLVAGSKTVPYRVS
jgi:hypothetical protein